MPTTFCPDCGAILDRVSEVEACPGCGGRRRGAHVVVPTLAVRLSLGEVGILVQNALEELVDLPVDQARDVVGQVVRLTGRSRGRGVLSGEPTLVAGEARAPALLRLVQDPVYGPLFLAWAGTMLGNQSSDAWMTGLRTLLARVAEPPPG